MHTVGPYLYEIREQVNLTCEEKTKTEVALEGVD